jgi:hypothetical protein
MKRQLIVLLSVFATISLFISLAPAQMEGKKWEKTLTLPNGEIILDLNGEWATMVEHYGFLKWYGSFPSIVEIKQEGSIFHGITLIATQRKPKGTESIRGELDANGFIKVQMITGSGDLDATGEIDMNGNKIIFDDGEQLKITMIRR